MFEPKTNVDEMEIQGMHWRKRPLVIQAVQLPYPFEVTTREGVMTGKANDYLCLGIAGERYPMDREIFEKSYFSENSVEGHREQVLDLIRISWGAQVLDYQEWDSEREEIAEMTGSPVDPLSKVHEHILSAQAFIFQAFRCIGSREEYYHEELATAAASLAMAASEGLLMKKAVEHFTSQEETESGTEESEVLNGGE